MFLFSSTSPEGEFPRVARNDRRGPHLPLREKVRGNGVSLQEKVSGNEPQAIEDSELLAKIILPLRHADRKAV